MKILVFLLLLASGAVHAETLFTQSKSGTISLVQGLDAKLCEVGRLKALSLPATDEEKNEAKRKDDAEKARRKSIDDAVTRWRIAHACELTGRAPPATDFSVKNSDGTCSIGADIDPDVRAWRFLSSSSLSYHSSSEIVLAECLK